MSVDAVDRLGLTAAGLRVVAVIQLAVYATIQVPVGVLVDRHGYRLMLGGAVTMALGRRRWRSRTASFSPWPRGCWSGSATA
ncbi:MAG TPA: hypothetical protein VI011_05750 [Asanoa sp.]